MGVDERFKVPAWQFQLVEDLDTFDAFPWGAYVYTRSIFGYKHVLDSPRKAALQARQGVHTVESYNIYGLAHALLVSIYKTMHLCFN